MKVSVVIPALNEEETVGNVVTQCLKSCADEVIVLDSDSADATAARAAAAQRFCEAITGMREGGIERKKRLRLSDAPARDSVPTPKATHVDWTPSATALSRCPAP